MKEKLNKEWAEAKMVVDCHAMLIPMAKQVSSM